MTTNEIRINHVELCELINKLRTEEGNRKELARDNFYKKIAKEVKTIKELSLTNSLVNFYESTYTNSRGREYPTFLMNKNGALQMALGESVYVRAKILEYIESLERKLKEQDIPSYQIDDRINRAKAWIKEEECRQQLYLENQELKQEIEELEEYKMFKSMINNCADSDMLLGKFGVFLKSNTPIKTGRNMIFGFCKQNGLVINQYKEIRYEDLAKMLQYIHLNTCRTKFICNYLNDNSVQSISLFREFQAVASNFIEYDKELLYRWLRL